MAAADDAAAELKENRFSYLLQPIRDLAANWDINIAGELEEYLDELEHLTFAIEGDSGPVLNFAEAALLIQVGCAEGAAEVWGEGHHPAVCASTHASCCSEQPTHTPTPRPRPPLNNQPPLFVPPSPAGHDVRVQQKGGVPAQPGVPGAGDDLLKEAQGAAGSGR
jgi:hypothetical protein